MTSTGEEEMNFLRIFKDFLFVFLQETACGGLKTHGTICANNSTHHYPEWKWQCKHQKCLEKQSVRTDFPLSQPVQARQLNEDVPQAVGPTLLLLYGFEGANPPCEQHRSILTLLEGQFAQFCDCLQIRKLSVLPTRGTSPKCPCQAENQFVTC